MVIFAEAVSEVGDVLKQDSTFMQEMDSVMQQMDSVKMDSTVMK
jgi:hypothetical protein